MTLSIVPVYAAIFALIFVALSMRVAMMRRQTHVGIGAGGDRILERRIRVQGNFAEYVPFALLLLALLEIKGTARWWMHALCLLLLVARLVHAYGVSHEPEDVRLRAASMIVTFAVIVSTALSLIIGALR
jgi:uncharacterized membrane protein YecN with MAPEG domain